MSRKMLLTLPLIALAGSAHAYDPIVGDRGWQQLAYDADQGCEAEARSNGQIVYINAIGLGADAPARYQLANGDMTPIDWAIRADGNGDWARYYIPFRPGHRGGSARVTIATSECSLDLAFDWQRGVTVIETDGTRHLETSGDAADLLPDY